MTIATDAPSSPTPPAPQKKSSLLKKLFKLFAVLFLLFVVAVVLVFLNLNYFVKYGVVRGGEYATDQTTVLNAADLSFSNGSLKLDGLEINNLKNYSAPRIITMKSCATTVESSSLFSSTVVVPSIVIDGMDVTLESKDFKTNLDELIAIINKKTASTGNTQASTSSGKNLKIGVVKLTNTKVHVIASGVLSLKLDFTLPDIEMTDPTNPDGRPMKIADLIGKIILHLAKGIIENPNLPGDLRNQMKNVTAMVDNLRGVLDKNVRQIGDLTKNLQGLGANATQTFQDATKNLQDAGKGLQDLGKGLPNPFGGDKK